MQLAVWSLVAEARTRLQDEFGPDGFTMGLNDGLAAGQTAQARSAVNICTLAHKADFPHCAVGTVIRSGRHVGRVTEVIDGGSSFRLFDFDAGLERTLNTAYLKEKYKATSAASKNEPTEAADAPQKIGRRSLPAGLDFCILWAVNRAALRISLANGRHVRIRTARPDLFIKAEQLGSKTPIPVLLYDADEKDRVNIGWRVQWMGWYCGKVDLRQPGEIELEDLTELPADQQDHISSLTKHQEPNCTPMGPSLITVPNWLSGSEAS